MTGVDKGGYHWPFLSIIATKPLRVVSQTFLPAQAQEVAISGDRALVVVRGPRGAQLLVFDIRDAAHLRLLQALDVPASGGNVVTLLVSGEEVILANGDGGVEVYTGGR